VNRIPSSLFPRALKQRDGSLNNPNAQSFNSFHRFAFNRQSAVRAENRRPAADDEGVEDLRVGRPGTAGVQP